MNKSPIKVTCVFMMMCYAVVFCSLNTACKKNSSQPPIDNDIDLDGNKINDTSLILPQNYLLSAAIPNPTSSDLNRSVIITVHGFSATNFEWAEFSDWAKSKTDVFVSRVLLGGHGRDYDDFKKATWEDWQAPIIAEYNKLKQMGYQKISLIGSSTGCPLILDMIATNKISMESLKHVFFVDPIIIPAPKILSLVKVVGPVIGYIETDLDPGEKGYWYRYRPQKALKELEELIKKERKDLEKGIIWPANVSLKVFKAEKDNAADPLSAVTIDKGVKKANGAGVQIEMVNTNLHVFTRLRGRAVITAEQTATQQKTFEEIYSDL